MGEEFDLIKWFEDKMNGLEKNIESDFKNTTKQLETLENSLENLFKFKKS